MKLSKREAIKLCNGCPTKMQGTCVFLDIDGAQTPEIDPPTCLKRRRQTENAKNQKNLSSFIGDDESGQPPKKHKRHCHKIKSEEDQINSQIPLTFKLDKLDHQILKNIMDGCYRNEIIRNVNKPATTVRGHLDKLLRNNIIKKNPELIGFKRMGYLIFNPYVLTLIKQGGSATENGGVKKKSEPVRFTKHHCSFKAEIINGDIPKGDRTFSPNNWQGQIFDKDAGGNYVIRVIPNKATGKGMAVIDINIDLGADSHNNLHGKYLTFAVKYLGEWSEKHKIQLSQPSEYRKPHVAIEGSRGLAQAILGEQHGEVVLENFGVRIDKSDKGHEGEVEFAKKKTETPEQFDKKVSNFEYMLNQSPEDIAKLSKEVHSLHDGVGGIKQEVNNVQQWLIVSRENDLLREQNQLLKDQLRDINKQLEEIKAAVGMNPPKEPKSGYSKYDAMMIYG